MGTRVIKAVIIPEVEEVVYNIPYTIVNWSDGTKTIVKCGDGEVFSEEAGLSLAIAKRFFGSRGAFLDAVKYAHRQIVAVG